jgi:hypothetical protein
MKKLSMWHNERLQAGARRAIEAKSPTNAIVACAILRRLAGERDSAPGNPSVGTMAAMEQRVELLVINAARKILDARAIAISKA